ncbi:MAG TPA: hypothetical protein VGB50_12295 [Flavobacterium sp.]|jgi:hypothetical protein
MKMHFVKRIAFLLLLLFSIVLTAQETAQNENPKSDFWQKVQIGGGFGLSIGNGYTDVTLAPGAIYNFNRYFAAGIGLQGTYVKVRDEWNSWIYGGSILGLVNPIPQIQLSAELEQVRVNSEYELIDVGTVDDDFWNTALFVGVGYRTNNVTIGVRYNVLHDSDRRVYNEAFMPFVRIYF